MIPIFISGIGTGVGKTVVSAIVAEALQADYWKPVQTGAEEGTDSEWVRDSISNPFSEVHQESYLLPLPVSPHIAAREAGIVIELETILARYRSIMAVLEKAQSAPTDPGSQEKVRSRFLVIEGAGGLMVPLNQNNFMADLVKALDAPAILVSRKYLGSINHSLLTGALCRSLGIKTAGWVFNESNLAYEQEIETWSGIPCITSIPMAVKPNRSFIREQAERIRPLLEKALLPSLRAISC